MIFFSCMHSAYCTGFFYCIICIFLVHYALLQHLHLMHMNDERCAVRNCKPPFLPRGRYGVKPHLKHQHRLINEGSWGGGSGISNNVDSQKNNHVQQKKNKFVDGSSNYKPTQIVILSNEKKKKNPRKTIICGLQCIGTLDIFFASNHNIHKSSCGLCFWASDPLIGKFLLKSFN